MKGIAVCQECTENGNQKSVHFWCPNDGLIHADSVTFLCNKCKSSELIYQDGIYVCPKCLETKNSFECRICQSKEVELIGRGGKND